jgi:hypothetical protein
MLSIKGSLLCRDDLALRPPTQPPRSCELTILLPCLNEAETLGICIRKARRFLTEAGVDGEVLVADNGSTDGSRQIAEAEGARVVTVPTRGYGSAVRHGIEAARGHYVIMGDSDDSYDLGALHGFLANLRRGDQLVMGNRFRGGILPGAMPLLNRWLGNPFLSMVGRLFFGSPCGDFHCGLRGFTRAAMLRLGLRSAGMELASEMVVKATIAGLRISEVPTRLARAGRTRAPHLRRWRDGWRHLRFLLLFAPRWLFLLPGAALSVTGAAIMAWLLPGPRILFGVTFDIHTLLYAACAVTVGVQSMLFWMFAKAFGLRERLAPPDTRFDALVRYFRLEWALMVAGGLLLIGLILGFGAIGIWSAADLGPISAQRTMRLAIPSAALIMMAFQLAYGAFFMSVLALPSSDTFPLKKNESRA